MDHPDIGRKKSIYWGYGITALCSLLLMIVGEDQTYMLLAMFFIIKIFITIVFMVFFNFILGSLSIFNIDLLYFIKRKSYGYIFLSR
jgi:hypothetical protein